MSDFDGITDGPIFEFPVEVPDVAECLVGWKVLVVETRSGLLRSQATAKSFIGAIVEDINNGYPVWPTDGPFRAECPRGHRPPCETGPVGTPTGTIARSGTGRDAWQPEIRYTCSGTGWGCGIYAYDTVRQAIDHCQPCPCCTPMMAVVRLELGGRFIRHASGIRAEYAMITGIVDPFAPAVRAYRHLRHEPTWRHERNQQLDHQIARNYDVPVLGRLPGLPDPERVAEAIRAATQSISGSFEAIDPAALEALLGTPKPNPGLDGTRQAMRDSLRQRRRGK